MESAKKKTKWKQETTGKTKRRHKGILVLLEALKIADDNTLIFLPCNIYGEN